MKARHWADWEGGLGLELELEIIKKKKKKKKKKKQEARKWEGGILAFTIMYGEQYLSQAEVNSNTHLDPTTD